MNFATRPGTGDGLDRALKPRSVAILGASDDATRISGRPLSYLQRAGFSGGIYPVNNRREVVQGLKAYASLAEVPEVPDVALVVLPGALTKAAVEECVEKGVGAAVLFAAGFAEVGEDGKAIQDEVVAIARAGGLRLFGPNCIGLVNNTVGFAGTFSSAFDAGRATSARSIAIVSQSGAYAGHLAYLSRMRGLPISYWVSTGNEADVDLGECIAWLARQDEVTAIMAYAEGVQHGPRFIEALRIAHEARKPIVFAKVGQSPAGAAAVTSHTASLAGADAVFEALFRQHGVHRARTTQEQIDIAQACALGRYPQGRKVGIITVSGGFGIELCDAAERDGLEVTPLPQPAQEKLRAINPLGNPGNPCDTTANFINDMSVITTTFRTMYADGGYDGLIGSFTVVPASTNGERLKEAIRAGTEGYLDRPTILCMAAPAEVERSYEAAGFLVYSESTRATRVLSALASLREAFERTLDVPPLDRRLARDLGTRPLSEFAAQKLLAGVGVPFLPARLVTSALDAADTAVALGLPAAMKIVSPDIPHKTEIGGVMLGVASGEAAGAAYATLLERAALSAPHAAVEGVMVAPMAPKGVETIIGVTRDPVFGPVVMFGLGGIFTELFQDVSFRVAPFGREEALRMMRETRGYALLAGFRGRPRADIDALADLICRVSQFAAANAETLETLDLNPVLVREAGHGVVALDALLVPRS